MSLDIDEILQSLVKKEEEEKEKEKKKTKKVEAPKTTVPETIAVIPVPANVTQETEQAVSVNVEVKEPIQETTAPPTPLQTDITSEVEKPKVEVKINIPEHEKQALEKIEEEGILEEEVPAPPKLVITIYGEKGTGKTTTALSFRERVAVFSFDGKSAIVKYNMYQNDPRIKVFNPLRHWDKSDKSKIPESARKVWDMINKTIEHLAKTWKPDWIVIDAVEEFEKLLEQVMRHDYGLGPYDGIANRNIWKYRKDLFMSFLHRVLGLAKYGVIFTTYPEYSEHISQGEVISRKPVPRWADYLQLVTDIVLFTFVDERTSAYKVKIITSKLDDLFPSGKTYDVTGTNLWEVLNLTEKIKKLGGGGG